MDFERAGRRSKEPNLTPLVDIILMLVIFFMLTTSFVISESMELSLPSGSSAPAAPVADIMRIRIEPSGNVVVNEQLMDRTGLNQLLVTQLANKPDSKIAIFTTPGVNVQQLVSILDEVYLTGGTNVQVDKIEYAG